MNAILSKLRYKPGMKTLVISMPNELRAYFSGMVCQTERLHPDFLVEFVREEEQFTHEFNRAARLCSENTLFWIAYPKVAPKGKHGLNRHKLSDLSASLGFKPISQISIDHVWAALLLKSSEVH